MWKAAFPHAFAPESLETKRGPQLIMVSRGPLAIWHGLLLLLLLPLPSHGGPALRPPLPSQTTEDSPALHLSNGPGQEPVTIMTFNLTKISKISSSFEFRTWDPEGVIFYGDTNPKNDWFMLGLRDGRPEIQLHNHWAQLTVSAGPRLDDGRWHQMEVKIHGDSLLLRVDGVEVLRLRQVFGQLANNSQLIMRIALGGLLFPASDLRLPLVPALDACLRQDDWLDQRAQTSASVPTSVRSCAVESQPGIFFPPGTGAEFGLQEIPQPHAEPWAFSLDLALQLAAGSGRLFALGTPENPSWLSIHLQDQKVVLSSGSGPGLDLPLVLGLPLQLKLTVSRVVLSHGAKKEILALPPTGPGSLLDLWVQPQGRLFLGALPGDAASASFCLDGLWAQGQSLDMDRAQSRSLNIWTHSCPQNPGNGSDTTH
ncbi:sex hormone-binding globulin isoform X1 [Oryx dammah]|uniref:sex hormone-binding globulin isoform X1 n=1 Tax=Oryx dammah TaxID=59534 RepID=UPI001A9A8E97|nr:sex hormone-binding globulin isoform X1 [Oryx dammah]XP_040099405.1 sex hormone-binding globulin isoform X1 [Oryx dammah]XP_040099406.1 sex hormone-binding globulin isoform X1 [Oryx dammah]XP_040099407.1 sex hormone-binding globulin isoform X1 [Oryx dammah]